MIGRGAELDDEDVRSVFHELSGRLAASGVHAQLFVVGGAATALAYQQGRLTRDVDALFVPGPEVRRAAEAIAADRGLEPNWLNDAAKGFLPGQDENPATIFESESLLVQVASPEYLLAMKLHASRDERDLDDAATLFGLLGYRTAQQATDLLTSTYPIDRLLPRHRYVAQDVAERAAARRAAQRPAPREADPLRSETVEERRSKLAPAESLRLDSARPSRHQPPSLGRCHAHPKSPREWIQGSVGHPQTPKNQGNPRPEQADIAYRQTKPWLVRDRSPRLDSCPRSGRQQGSHPGMGSGWDASEFIGVRRARRR